MKKYNLVVLLMLLIGAGACDNKILDLESLTEPVDATFYSNEQELELALSGAYNAIIYKTTYSTPIQQQMDNGASDVGVSRGNDGAGLIELGAGTHSASTGGFQVAYSNFYRGIARTNSLLQNMERAKKVVPENRYKEIQAQALVLRAYQYMLLTEMFGDVPLIDGVITSSEALLPRTPKSTIVDKMLADLQLASDALPYTWSGSNSGKITKGVALTLRARIALYNKKYDVAAVSAKAVMDNEQSAGYSLNPSYEKLFQLSGQTSAEIMMVMPYKDGFSQSQYSLSQGSRNLGAFSVVVPTQSMIDSYEATDGKPIDESGVYDPHKPFENRDPRLKASIITPQSKWAGIIFESHPDSLKYRKIDGTIGGNNSDNRKVSWPGAFCGYLWKKYTIEETQVAKGAYDFTNFILIRYAEVLLTYAEAKIEAGQIDASVLTAINRIRARAYGVDISNIAGYPAITTTNQAELRKVIRRERKVELADEGFRLFDIRRWKIAEKVMPVVIYGRILNTATATKVPQIDDDCFVSYAGIESQYDLNTEARFPNAQNRVFNKSRDYLCPIPQQEIDTYKSLGKTLDQNPGY
jgi:hypothetical protein